MSAPSARPVSVHTAPAVSRAPTASVSRGAYGCRCAMGSAQVTPPPQRARRASRTGERGRSRVGASTATDYSQAAGHARPGLGTGELLTSGNGPAGPA